MIKDGFGLPFMVKNGVCKSQSLMYPSHSTNRHPQSSNPTSNDSSWRHNHHPNFSPRSFFFFFLPHAYIFIHFFSLTPSRQANMATPCVPPFTPHPMFWFGVLQSVLWFTDVTPYAGAQDLNIWKSICINWRLYLFPSSICFS